MWSKVNSRVRSPDLTKNSRSNEMEKSKTGFSNSIKFAFFWSKERSKFKSRQQRPQNHACIPKRSVTTEKIKYKTTTRFRLWTLNTKRFILFVSFVLEVYWRAHTCFTWLFCFACACISFRLFFLLTENLIDQRQYDEQKATDEEWEAMNKSKLTSYANVVWESQG